MTTGRKSDRDSWVKALKFEEDQNLQAALPIWKRLAEETNDAGFFLRYGWAADRLGLWPESEAAYLRSLNLKPEFVAAMQAIASLFAHRTDMAEIDSFEASKAWWLKASELSPTAEILTPLGAVYVALGDSTAARATFEKAVRIDPSYEEALYNLASLLPDEESSRAIALLESAVKIDPDYLIARQLLGRLFQHRKDYGQAEHEFRECLRISPKEYWSLLYLANLLAVVGNLAESETVYREAINSNPTDRAAPEFFANMLEELGRRNEAEALRESS